MSSYNSDILNAALSRHARNSDKVQQKQTLAPFYVSHPKPKEIRLLGRNNNARLLRTGMGRNPLFELSKDSAFQDTPGPLIPERIPSPMEELHKAVYFDEADFDDDNDLEFEGAGLDTKPLEKVRNPAKSSDNHGSSMTDTSYPIECSWASSPSEHKTGTMRNKEDHSKPVSNISAYNKSAADLMASTHALSKNETKARRTLPWVFQDKNNSAMKDGNNEPGLYPTSVRQISLEEMSGSKNQPRHIDQPRKRQISTSHGDKKRPIKRPRNSAIKLSGEQEAISSLVCEAGQSVFFTGSAGTGKSVLLREIIQRLRNKYQKDPEQIAITASTGLAACNIGGVTLHSFAGIGLGKGNVTELVKNIKKNKKSVSKWLRTKVLIMDEISMVDGHLFDKLEEIARTFRRTTKPFGGIQLVVTGDFFQLPPVPDSSQANSNASTFAFEAKSWAESVKNTIALTQVFRQQDEGSLSNSSIDQFKRLSRGLEFDDGIEPTELFPTRREVDAANATRMKHLHGETKTYTANDSGRASEMRRQAILQNCMAPEELNLKVNCQVMLIKNRDDGLVNGSLGKVLGFICTKAYQISKSNGELDEEVCNFNVNEENLDTNRKKIRQEKVQANKEKGNGKTYPFVQFSVPGGQSRSIAVEEETWKYDDPGVEGAAERRQVPLILAWALSIHKAQGQTLERVKVDLGKVFEKGQAYVALSRSTSMKGLQVLRFDAKKVMTHKKVATFYGQLNSALLAQGGGHSTRDAATVYIDEESDDEEIARRETIAL